MRSNIISFLISEFWKVWLPFYMGKAISKARNMSIIHRSIPCRLWIHVETVESPVKLWFLDLADSGVILWMIYILHVPNLCPPSEIRSSIFHFSKERFNFHSLEIAPKCYHSEFLWVVSKKPQGNHYNNNLSSLVRCLYL